MTRLLFVASLTACLAVGLGCAPDEGAESTPDGVPSSLAVGKADTLGADGAIDWAAVAARCAPPAADEPVIYSNFFSWGYTPEAMAARFDEIYTGAERLADRARYDAARDQFILPDTPAWGGEVVLPRAFVESVRAHVERALAFGYVDHVFFPDMGHSHFFIPQTSWDDRYAGRPVTGLSAMRAELLADPGLRVLYHTAEQLQMLDEEDHVLPDRHIQWRFYTRNLVGDAEGRLDLITDLEQKANTARDLPGHHYYGGGFNISANADGCFPYVHDGEVRYFDLSLEDLPPDPSVDYGEF